MYMPNFEIFFNFVAQKSKNQLNLLSVKLIQQIITSIFHNL